MVQTMIRQKWRGVQTLVEMAKVNTGVCQPGTIQSLSFTSRGNVVTLWACVQYLTAGCWVRKSEAVWAVGPSFQASNIFSLKRGYVRSPRRASVFALAGTKKGYPAVSKHLLESPSYKSLIGLGVNRGQNDSSQSSRGVREWPDDERQGHRG